MPGKNHIALLRLKALDAPAFFFTRLQYNSGDWNTDQRMPSNLLHSLVEYTTIPVDTQERVVPLSSEEVSCLAKSGCFS